MPHVCPGCGRWGLILIGALFSLPPCYLCAFWPYHPYLLLQFLCFNFYRLVLSTLQRHFVGGL